MEDPRETSIISLAVIAFAVAVAMMGYLVVHSTNGAYSATAGVEATQ